MKRHLFVMPTVLLITAMLGLWVSDVTAQNKRVFVTSVSGTGNLGDPAQWPDNGGLTGLDAADAVCRARAAAGGLDNPDDFVAWLSDSTDDAYCRVHGLAGTKAANCGQATLPVSAGPWVRMDDHPFAESIALALRPSGRVYAPVELDELGDEVWHNYFTATDEDGAAALGHSTCGDWTSASPAAVGLGAPWGTTDRWSYVGFDGAGCSLSLHLLCIEAGGQGPALPPFGEYGAQTFVTSVSGTGDLSSWADPGGNQGIAAGDAICQARATAVGLDQPESFKAWLSDGSIDVADRLTTDGPWVRLDGVPVARSKRDLTLRVLFSANNLTEDGEYTNDWAITGTDPFGVATGNDCGGWTDGSSGTATAGLTPYASLSWTAAAAIACSQGGRLYCFSDTMCWRNAPILCLDEERFTIEVEWEDFSGNTGDGLAVPLTSDTGYLWFFRDSNVELIIKVLDGRTINGMFWVFYGALSNVEYDITVTDTLTGGSVSYHNPSGNFASVGDTSALPGEAQAAPTKHRHVEAPLTALDLRTARMYTELMQLDRTDAGVTSSDACTAGSTTLCLNNGRFSVEVEWEDFRANTGDGQAVPLTNDTGYFWFFRDTNVELVVKVLDGRSINDHFWVFYGALSNVEYTITVTDTVTNEIKTYFNPSESFGSVGDTGAFYVP